MAVTGLAVVDDLNHGLRRRGQNRQRRRPIVDLRGSERYGRPVHQQVVIRRLVRCVADEVNSPWRIGGETHAKYQKLAAAQRINAIKSTDFIDQTILGSIARGRILISRSKTDGSGAENPRLEADVEIR